MLQSQENMFSKNKFEDDMLFKQKTKKIHYKEKKKYLSPQECNFKLDQQKIQKLISQLPKRLLKIDKEEVCEGIDILKVFQCKKCFGVPRPNILECKHCDAIFCEECIDEIKKKNEINDNFLVSQNVKFQSVKCPSCLIQLESKPLNRRVKEMAMNQLKFSHCCTKKLQDISHKFNLSDSVDEQIHYQNNIKERPEVKTRELNLNKMAKLNQIENQNPFSLSDSSSSLSSSSFPLCSEMSMSEHSDLFQQSRGLNNIIDNIWAYPQNDQINYETPQQRIIQNVSPSPLMQISRECSNFQNKDNQILTNQQNIQQDEQQIGQQQSFGPPANKLSQNMQGQQQILKEETLRESISKKIYRKMIEEQANKIQNDFLQRSSSDKRLSKKRNYKKIIDSESQNDQFKKQKQDKFYKKKKVHQNKEELLFSSQSGDEFSEHSDINSNSVQKLSKAKLLGHQKQRNIKMQQKKQQKIAQRMIIQNKQLSIQRKMKQNLLQNEQIIQQPKIFTYDEYINHRKNECSLNQVYNCPNCYKMKSNDLFAYGGAFNDFLESSRCKDLMSLTELKDHLENECLFTEFECKVCGLLEKRGNIFERHTKQKCIKYLQKKVQDLQNQQNKLDAHQKEGQKFIEQANIGIGRLSIFGGGTTQTQQNNFQPYRHGANTEFDRHLRPDDRRTLEAGDRIRERIQRRINLYRSYENL